MFSEADSRQVIFLFLFTLLIPSIHLNSSVYTMSTRLPLLRCLRTRLGVFAQGTSTMKVTLVLMPGSNEINIVTLVSNLRSPAWLVVTAKYLQLQPCELEVNYDSNPSFEAPAILDIYCTSDSLYIGSAAVDINSRLLRIPA